MDNQIKATFGAWIQAIGTVIAAIGGTPSQSIRKELLEHLDLWGNVLQGTGNALSADAMEGVSLGKIGNEIQAIGNSLVVAGLVLDLKNENEKRLIIMGNWFQALGSAAALEEDLHEEITIVEMYNIIGNLLQSIGNSLQAIGGAYELHEDESSFKSRFSSQSLSVSGGWIQAVGSVLTLLAQLKENVKDTDDVKENRITSEGIVKK